MITAAEARKAVDDTYAVFASADEALTSRRPAPDAWTLKEIVGHMIDAASNSHQRILRLQLDPTLELGLYDAEKWVAAAGYDAYAWPKLLELWKTYGELLLHMLARIDPAALGNKWVTPVPPKTLEEIVDGYYSHLAVHREHFLLRLREVRGE